jgi:phosphate starvation-inducible protein PhoH
LVDAIKNDMVFAVVPGTGKSTISYGYQGSKEKQVKRIILTRPARQRILVFFLGI